MEETRAIESAVAQIEPDGRVVEITEMTGGVSALVRRIDVRVPSGDTRRLVFRQHRSAGFKAHHHEVIVTEFRLLEALHDRGFPVPRALCLDDSGMLTAPFLVMEWIDGTTDVSKAALGTALEQMAEFLARLHALDPAAAGTPALQPLEDPLDALPQYLPTDDARERIRSAALGGLPVGNPPVLIHGDYWPGNVMWRDGRLAAVLDWEDARTGDPLADLACARLELLCQYGEDAMEEFTAHYLRFTREDRRPLRTESLPLWELYVSASALATMATWGLDADDERRRRHTTERFHERAWVALVG